MSRKDQDSGQPWSQEYWERLNAETTSEALSRGRDDFAWKVIARQARIVLKSYSTSFFIVTRFLPPVKRAQVESIYAAVRFPDEVVDTFPIGQSDKLEVLNSWQAAYLRAVELPSLVSRLEEGIPCFVAAFAEVVRRSGIPVEHYIDFLKAMRLDVCPRRFETIEDLIDSYIYGSAIVVGYFLAYVYGPSEGTVGGPVFEDAIEASRDLGIALQLTNFLRDVAEDQRRGRLYVPMDLLGRFGIDEPDASDPNQRQAFEASIADMGRLAEQKYAIALAKLSAFAPDCRVAIRACIDVYGQLNRQILASTEGLQHRESVPMMRKFQVLPASKYWRLPLAYLS